MKNQIYLLIALLVLIVAPIEATHATQTPKERRDSIRSTKKVWTSLLGGPSYTPEASLGIAGAVLLSFKTNSADTISLRSYLPVGVNISINGTLVVAGGGALFFSENRFRIYTSYGIRNEPSDFYGVGIDQIESTPRGESTTHFDKSNIYLYNRFVWEVKPQIYIGPLLDINHSNSRNLNPTMAQNIYIQRYNTKYTNIGLGGLIQYDTRDDVATPHQGVLLSATAKLFGRYFGGSYNYQLLDIEYRQFHPLFSRAVVAWTARTQIGWGDIPFTELPTFGSPFDLRGFYWGEYRDRSMGYGIIEYRHMLGSVEAAAAGALLSKFGYVVWCGSGTIGASPQYWSAWRMNYGVGLRIQIQPRKNFRLDIGKGQGVDGVLIYFNMTEAF